MDNKIKKVDFSKYAKSEQKKNNQEESLMDNPLLMLAKSALPNLPSKIKYAIALALYLIITGIVANVYIIIKITLKLF